MYFRANFEHPITCLAILKFKLYMCEILLTCPSLKTTFPVSPILWPPFIVIYPIAYLILIRIN